MILVTEKKDMFKALSPTHKGNFLQGGKSSVSNLNQQNANHRRNSCSPPLSKNHYNNQQQQEAPNAIKSVNVDARKLERSVSEPATDRRAVQSNSSRYKTELCRPYEENGTCKYGDKCQFAHGMKELRSMARHPKYKTELCRTFHSTGLCPYGPRCHFIHNSEQAKKSLLTNLTGSMSPSPPMTRPKALNSLGSAGDLSPVSSHGGTPTGMKSFEELFQSNPLSPGVTSFSGTPEFTFANAVVNNLQRYGDLQDRDFSLEICNSAHTFSETGLSNTDANIDNYNYQGGPVLDLFQTTPVTPTTPADANSGLFRFTYYDLFQKQ